MTRPEVEALLAAAPALKGEVWRGMVGEDLSAVAAPHGEPYAWTWVGDRWRPHKIHGAAHAFRAWGMAKDAALRQALAEADTATRVVEGMRAQHEAAGAHEAKVWAERLRDAERRATAAERDAAVARAERAEAARDAALAAMDQYKADAHEMHERATKAEALLHEVREAARAWLSYFGSVDVAERAITGHTLSVLRAALKTLGE